MEKHLSIHAPSEPMQDASVPVESGATWKDYVQLMKPGILRSNVIAAFGGFWLASHWSINWALMIFMLIGTSLIIASSCVFNNFLDREFDRKMARTRSRALPSGRVQPTQVLWFGTILGLAGLTELVLLVNTLTAVLGLIGMFFYVIIYTAWLKRTSTLSTVMGSFSGSMPPVMGYVAVSGAMDAGAWILFAILFLWQPPHFWALGIRRKEEYRAAGFMILPVVKGTQRTKLQMIPYIVLLIPVSTLLYYYGYVGIVHLSVSVVLGGIWLIMALAGLKSKNDDIWARNNFIFSINYLMITFLIMIIDTAK
ncbi:heme o synthase [Ferviditalea candida]|uniref:Protoheme IX farnesyltransferase n=1 Tax=Ferviditalea candida TaxID=3108399 RepID=A0ABU5ZDK3_9BACL|nr:heme o synthase [Paenibacillaceae bacterium T2]